MKVCRGCGMRRIPSRLRNWAEIWVGMTGLIGNLGQDYGIERKFGWRWWDWISLLETFDNVGGDILVNRPFGHCAEGVYGQFYTIYKAKPRFDLLLFSGSPARKVYYTTYKFQTAIAVSWKHRRTGWGGEGGCSPPKFWATQIFWAARENLGKTSFLTRFRVFEIIILRR